MSDIEGDCSSCTSQGPLATSSTVKRLTDFMIIRLACTYSVYLTCIFHAFGTGHLLIVSASIYNGKPALTAIVAAVPVAKSYVWKHNNY